MQNKPNPSEETLSGMLEYLNLQMDNFTEIRGFIVTNNVTSSSLLLSQTLQLIDGELTRNPNFLYQCFELLDTINVLSVSIYGDADSYINALIKGIVSSRVSLDFEQTLAQAVTTNIYFNSDQELDTFLRSNKYLISIYIYAVMMTITYRNK